MSCFSPCRARGQANSNNHHADGDGELNRPQRYLRDQAGTKKGAEKRRQSCCDDRAHHIGGEPLKALTSEGKTVHQQTRDIDDHRRDNAGCNESFFRHSRLDQEGRAQGPLIAGETAEKSREQAAQNEKPGRKLEFGKFWAEFEQRKEDDQRSDHRAKRRDLMCPAAQIISREHREICKNLQKGLPRRQRRSRLEG